jgi:hypothetical protein
MDRRLRLMVVTVMLFIGMIAMFSFSSIAVTQVNRNIRQATQATVELNQ